MIIDCFQITEDQTGLLMRFDDHKKLDPVENMFNGRIIPLRDFVGCSIESPGVSIDVLTVPVREEKGSASPMLEFTLYTSEDCFPFEMAAGSPGGWNWLKLFRQLVGFVHLPSPVGRVTNHHSPNRTNTNNNRDSVDRSLSSRVSITSSSSHSHVSLTPSSNPIMSNNNSSVGDTPTQNPYAVDFSGNSGTVFTCSGDVAVYLQSMPSAVTKFKLPILNEIAQSFQEAFQLMPEVKSNKETFHQFGERLEDVVRVLTDPKTGVLTLAKSSDGSLLFFHLSTLSNKLKDAISFLKSHSESGWLVFAMKPGGSVVTRLKAYDTDITHVANVLIRAVGDPRMAFATMKYDSGVDVRKSVDALGGVDGIYRDTAKLKALARLIQADPGILQEEITYLMSADSGGNSPSRRGSHDYSGRSQAGYSAGNSNGMNNANNNDYNRQPSCFARYFCCCFVSSRHAPSRSTSGTGKVELETPLFH